MKDELGGAVRRLRVVEAPPAMPQRQRSVELEEVRTMLDVAAELHRHAGRLRHDSPLRAELTESAEYYRAGAEQAWATGTMG